MTQEIIKKGQPVESLISQAIEKGVGVETMERLFALREKIKAEQAKEAFVEAMADFQAVCPVIDKTKKVLNQDGSIRYKYAPIDSIVEKIKTHLAKSGLAYTWTVKNEPGFITATAMVTHKLGHSETSSFQIPIDAGGFMTAPQKVASALTYAKRYSLCNVLGISTGDEDDDSTSVGKEKVAKSDKAKIVFLLKNLGENIATAEDIKAAILRLTKVESTKENYSEIVSRLEVLIKEKNEDKEIQ